MTTPTSEQKWYQPRDDLLRGKVPKRYRQIGEILKQVAGGAKVLDIGCNAGLVSLLAARHGAARVTGIDKRENFLEQARFLLGHWKEHGYLQSEADVRFLCADLRRHLELFDEHDVFVLIRVIYHLKDSVAGMFERLAKKDGAIVLIQGNPARRDKCEQETGPYGNKLALADNILAFVNEYGFEGRHLGDEIVLAARGSKALDLSRF